MRPWRGGERATEDALCHLDTSGLTVDPPPRRVHLNGANKPFFLWLESLTESPTWELGSLQTLGGRAVPSDRTGEHTGSDEQGVRLPLLPVAA